MSVASRSAADMLEVGWPEPALLEERTESTRSWAASSGIWSRSSPSCMVVVMWISFQNLRRWSEALRQVRDTSCRTSPQIGRASCRERVKIAVADGALKKQKQIRAATRTKETKQRNQTTTTK